MQLDISCNLTFPKKLVFGIGTASQLDQLTEATDRILLLTDKVLVQNGTIAKLLQNAGPQLLGATVMSDVPIEPTAEQVQTLISTLGDKSYDVVIAIGGGSILDTAKLIAGLSHQPFTVYDLLDDPSVLKKRGTKLILIPSTAGTGSEVTPNSIVLDQRVHVKVGIVNACFVSDYVVLDAALIKALPPALTASTGMDALAHAVECYTSNKANSISDMFAKKASEMIFRNLQKAYDHPDDMDARGQMLLAACLAGFAITASGTTAVHALSYPLGGKYRIPHGVSNAILLPPVMRFNADSVGDRLADLAASCPDVFAEPSAEAVIEKLYALKTSLGLPQSFSAFGVHPEDIDNLAEQALTVRRLLNNNKKELTFEDIRTIYKEVI